MNTNVIRRFLQLSLLCAGLLFTACSVEQIEDSNQEIIPADIVVKKYFGDIIVYVTKDKDGNWRSDDMMFTDNQLSDTPNPSLLNEVPDFEVDEKLAFASYATKWPNGVVIYKIGNLSDRLKVELQKAMEEWSSKTNVRFKRHTNESYYVTIKQIVDGCSGCGWATIGANGTKGTCNFGPNASASLIAHELGHTLGFLHEQTREDRDQYVTIVWSNIKAGKEGNFRKSQSAQSMTKAFDINSIMMYHPYAFSIKRGEPTITLKNGEIYRGAQQKVSALDIEGTNKVYPNSTNPDPDPVDICKGVDAWQSGKTYYVGNRVTYNGYLYEADYSRWNRIGKCGTSQPVDKCSGVSAWNQNTTYRAGDKVTYNGSLYTLTSERRWRNDGACGS